MTRDLKILSSSLLIWGFGEGLFIFFQPLLLQKMGADPFLIGTVLGSVALATGIAQIPLGWASDHIGARPFLLSSWVLGTFATILIAFSHSMTGILSGMVFYGLSGSIMAPLNSYYLTIRGTLSMQRVITHVTTLYSAGAISGSFFGGLLTEKIGLQSVYVVSAVIFSLSTFIVFFIQGFHPKQLHPFDSTNNTPHYSRPLQIYIILIFILLIVSYLPIPLTPNYLQEEKGLSYTQSGFLGSMISLSYIILINAISKTNKTVSLLSPLLGTFLFSVVVWKSKSYALFLAVYLFASSPRIIRAISAAYVRPLLHEARIGTGYGLLETSNSLAFVCSPIIAGWLTSIHTELVYPVTIFSLVFAFILVVFFFRKIHLLEEV